jgi:2-polyprenyl-3-methyl-5-hydroxy-6-metoxy-1,4-benzoquinol methylase
VDVTSSGSAGDDRRSGQPMRIGILVVAYNAESILTSTLDRIPEDFRSRLAAVFICDDASGDKTYEAGLGWRQANSMVPTTVIRHPHNLGYGGNQKVGYQLAIEHDLDVIVLLHGDGQYAPEYLPQMVQPLLDNECDAVFGSRMMEPGGASRGGMPLYKFIGNRVLTKIENTMLGSSLTEFHSGYRAYSVRALRSIPFAENSDGFDFDTQIIVQLLDAGKRIVEIPIPTYYGDEICYVNGMKYAWDVVKDVVQYRVSRLGFGTHAWVAPREGYELKESEGTSHDAILTMAESRPPGRVLDLGCSGGRLAERLRAQGHEVVGVDREALPGIEDRVDTFIVADLEAGIPAAAGGPYDTVIAADVIEHMQDPTRLLREARELLAEDGELLVSVPNFVHWYPRLRVALGRFDYDRRGILDQTHLRFFTRRTFLRMMHSVNLEVMQFAYTGLPFDVLADGGTQSRWLRSVDRALVRSRPTLFGYQFVVRPRPRTRGKIEYD